MYAHLALDGVPHGRSKLNFPSNMWVKHCSVLFCQGMSALHLAAKDGQDKMVTLLLQCGADPKLKCIQVGLEVWWVVWQLCYFWVAAVWMAQNLMRYKSSLPIVQLYQMTASYQNNIPLHILYWLCSMHAML